MTAVQEHDITQVGDLMEDVKFEREVADKDMTRMRSESM